jgi:hypothetical protein
MVEWVYYKVGDLTAINKDVMRFNRDIGRITNIGHPPETIV